MNLELTPTLKASNECVQYVTSALLPIVTRVLMIHISWRILDKSPFHCNEGLPLLEELRLQRGEMYGVLFEQA